MLIDLSFNVAHFFQDERTEQKTAAGGMYIIMRFLWLIGIPVLIVAIVMVRIAIRFSNNNNIICVLMA